MRESHEIMRAVTQRMLNEELLMILDRIKDSCPLTLLQTKVMEEAERRRLRTRVDA